MGSRVNALYTVSSRWQLQPGCKDGVYREARGGGAVIVLRRGCQARQEEDALRGPAEQAAELVFRLPCHR